MKRRIAIILAVVSVLSLAGCGRGRTVFLFEQPYWSSHGGGVLLRARLGFRALARASLPVFLVTGPGVDPRAVIASELAKGTLGTAVIGPLLSLDAGDLAQAFPAVRFVLILGSAEPAPTPANVTILSFDRRDAFRTAGAAAALAAEGSTAAAASHPSPIAILTGDSSDLSAEEIRAFREGVASESGGRDPITRTFSASPEPSSVQTAVSELRTSGVRVFLLALGAANPACLDALKSIGGSAVVADWASSRADPQQVLISVETDDIAAIMNAVTVAGPRAGSVKGATRLVIGEAGPLSPAARARIAAQR